jgi:hypothetical protein
MNVETISVDKDYALEQLEKYKSIVSTKRVKEDTDMRRMWKWATEHTLIDAASALKETGLNDAGLPKLALVRANWSVCHWSTWTNAFSSSARYHSKQYAIKLPQGTYPRNAWKTASTSVPFIPPDIRPDDNLSKYHILFEVQSWTEYPRDPFLLKQISGWIFAVIGEWDLTPLEAMLLQGLRASA